ncbi:glycosyltransferase family 39 protein [Candidatus Roizmanbacteria bacterium]|nr:glycosyltransferase family 39 protein [Candidatus Roizmanbacteria bacterium]
MLNFLFTKTPLAYFVWDFWRDEAYTYLFAKRGLSEIITLSPKDFSPPLYYLILNIWMKMFGTSEIAIRSLSLLFYAATFFFVYLFLRNVLKVKTRWLVLYLILFLLSPFLNYYAFEARMYAMFACFATMSFYFLQTEKRRWYILTTILGLYTHYFMVFVLLSQLLYVALNSNSKRLKIAKFKAMAFSFFIFIPWVIFLFTNNALFAQGFWILPAKNESIWNLPSILYLGYEFDFAFFDRFLLPGAIILYLFILKGVHLIIKERERKYDLLYLLLLWSFFTPLAAYFLSFVKPLFLPRYFIFSSVGFFLLLVFIFKHFDTHMKILFVVLLVAFALHYTNLQLVHRKKAPVKNLMGEIKNLSGPNDLVYVSTELDYFLAQYYFDENKVYIYNKTYEEIPAFVGKVLIPKDRITRRLPFYPQKAFVVKEDLTYTIQATY